MHDTLTIRRFFSRQHILVLTDDVWNSPKRLRHKMPQQWARAGAKVLWIEKPVGIGRYRQRPGAWQRCRRGRLEKIEEGLWAGSSPLGLPWSQDMHHSMNRLSGPLYGKFCLRRIHRYLRRLKFQPSMVVLIQHALREDVFRAFPSALKVYYSTDLYGYFKQTSISEHLEARACDSADVILTTSETQAGRLHELNPEVHVLPHAVDPEWWDSAPTDMPGEFNAISSPRAVFTGVLDGKVDVPLLKRVAEITPEIQFVLVGPDRGWKEHAPLLGDMKQMPNCHLLGSRDYEALPPYIRHADFLLFPIRPSDLSEHIGLPLKFFEYCISGHPVIATRFGHLDNKYQDLVYAGDSAESWRETLLSLVRNPETDTGKAERRISAARENTYERRLQRQVEIFEQLEAHVAGRTQVGHGREALG